MIPPSAKAQLDMLRHAPKPIAAATPTKRPHGGRPNPCALHRPAESRPIVVRRAKPPGTRINVHRPDLGPGPHDRFVAAVLSGRLPVGVPIKGTQIRQAIGDTSFEMLSTNLAGNRSPCRLRHIGPGHACYRIDLV